MTSAVEPLDVVRIRSWEKYSWLRHGFSTRAGGVSTAYGGASLNLGWTKEDASSHVQENRRRLLQAVGGPDSGFAMAGMRQVHSSTICEVRPEDAVTEGRLATAEGKPVLEGDGLITGVPGVLIAVGTADCVPVLVADTRRRVVAALHAGWRGTASRIVEAGIARMRQDYGSREEDLIAAVGPSIGPCCYAVGEEVHTAFVSGFRYADQLFRAVSAPEPWRRESPSGFQGEARLHLDLWEANRQQLLDAGVGESHLTVLGECTACCRNAGGKLKYFSHRGERGVAGRMLSVIGMVREA